MEAEGAETFLRQLAEAQLRHARTAGSLDDAIVRTHAVAAAFIATDVLTRPSAEDILADLDAAAALRHLAAGDGAQLLHALLWRPRRPPGVAPGVRPRLPPVQVRVSPVGRRLGPRGDGAGADLYLLALVAAPTRAWLTAATCGAPRAADLAAVDDGGREYKLGRAGGIIPVTPPPPPDAVWLDVTSGRQTVRVDLTAPCPAAEVDVSPLDLTPGERYLQWKAESLLSAPNPDRQARLLADLVAPLTAAGLVPHGSVVPGQLAALFAVLNVPGHALANRPESLPERWASLLASSSLAARQGPRDEPAGPPAAAHLTVAVPEVDHAAVTLAGLVTQGTKTTVFGQVTGVPTSFRAPAPGPPSWWLRDDRGQWHLIKAHSWSDDGFTTFEASVFPSLPPTVTRVEVYVTGGTMQARAALPLTWWARD